MMREVPLLKQLYLAARFVLRWLFRYLLLFITIGIPYLILAYIFGEAGRRWLLGGWISLALYNILNVYRSEWNLWLASCIGLILAWSVPKGYIFESILLVILGIALYREWLTSKGVILAPLFPDSDVLNLFKPR